MAYGSVTRKVLSSRQVVTDSYRAVGQQCGVDRFLSQAATRVRRQRLGGPATSSALWPSVPRPSSARRGFADPEASRFRDLGRLKHAEGPLAVTADVVRAFRPRSASAPETGRLVPDWDVLSPAERGPRCHMDNAQTGWRWKRRRRAVASVHVPSAVSQERRLPAWRESDFNQALPAFPGAAEGHPCCCGT